MHGSKFTEEDIPNLTGYVAIVTGGHASIGYETTKQLALHNARVYIAGRSKERVDRAIARMRQEAAAQAGGSNIDVRFLRLDLEDLASVKAAAATFTQLESKLNILINNAGVMGVPFQLTKDQFESHWQINFLAPFLLTAYLTSLMLSTAKAAGGSQHSVRVVNVSSMMAFHSGPRTIQLDDVNMTKATGMSEYFQRYGHSKQASIRHAKELNDRYSSQGLTAYSLHPGVIRSGLQDKSPSLMGKMVKWSVALTNRTTPLQGALTSLWCATSAAAPEPAQGRLVVPVGKVEGGRLAEQLLADREGNARLWKLAENDLRKRQLVNMLVRARPSLMLLAIMSILDLGPRTQHSTQYPINGHREGEYIDFLELEICDHLTSICYL